MHQQQTALENIVGKGEIACNEQFLLFPQFFLLNQIIVSPFVHIFDIISLFAAELEKPKIGISCKGLSLLTCTDNIPCLIRKLMIEWCFTPLLTVFQSYHGDSSHYSCFPGFHQY